MTNMSKFSWHYWWDNNDAPLEERIHLKEENNIILNCTTHRIWICWQDKIKINHSLNGILESWHDQLLEHVPQLPVSVNIFSLIQAQLIYEVQIIKANDLLSNNSNLTNTTTQSEVCSIRVTPFPETDDKPNSKGLSPVSIGHILTTL